MRHAVALVLAAVLAAPAHAGSLRFVENAPTHYDFVDIPSLPGEFGRGEFAFELWVKPDATYPIGPTVRASYAQLRNWTDADPEPYSSDGWWLAGNWLLDGHTRPEGFMPGDTREGTFSLQFYGGGRLRWTFADAKGGMPKGMVYAVQAWPATSTPSLLAGGNPPVRPSSCGSTVASSRPRTFRRAPTCDATGTGSRIQAIHRSWAAGASARKS